ncbi:MAG TPA: hypothetical protein VGQ20_18045, partial [Acidimicrobiales bacterium]|nr:hypothetical protein [Acidimicrobiales bacterium]
MTAPFAARARRRVLVVAPFVPSVDGAHGSSRAIGSLVAALADHHDVGVIYLRGLDEARIDPALEGRLAFTAEVPRPGPAPAGRRRVRLLASLARGRPMWVHHFWSHALDEAIKRAVRSFQPDVVQVELAVLAPALAA